jgi:hypothetical protein
MSNTTIYEIIITQLFSFCMGYITAYIILELEDEDYNLSCEDTVSVDTVPVDSVPVDSVPVDSVPIDAVDAVTAVVAVAVVDTVANQVPPQLLEECCAWFMYYFVS